ncbi:MFS general substrate transporter [Acrodontium crateriforme]|uniref:MFS general substrate transporter n=1 Tax=Acrodontium crateriforme TaxID=150365 RepID=A0AAQ3M7X2_9PEZI|nr:MFS general substrate transporter [Acrodontium crateriforme]
MMMYAISSRTSSCCLDSVIFSLSNLGLARQITAKSPPFMREAAYPQASTTRCDNEHVDEHTPLLPEDDIAHSQIKGLKWSSRTICAVVAVVVFLISMSDQLIEPAQTRIFESIICYEYWEHKDSSKIRIGRNDIFPGAIGGVDETWCKENDIQSRVATLRGWQQLFDGIPSVLLAVPFGWASDRFGRKPFVILGLLSFASKIIWVQLVCWFWERLDIRLTWLSALSGLLGGGSPVLTSLFYVVVSDVVSASHRAALFLRMAAIHKSASLLAPPICAVLMKRNPWIPLFIGTILSSLSILSWVFVPETLESDGSIQSSAASDQSSYNSGQNGHVSNQKDTPGMCNRIVAATSFLHKDWRIATLIAPFAIHMLGNKLSLLLLQYSSKRYELLLDKATLLLTIRAAVTALTMFIIIPFISKMMTKNFSIEAQRKDLYIARASALITSLGWLFVAISPNLIAFSLSLVICTLGAGCMIVLRSYLTSLVPTQNVARLFTLTSVVDILGNMGGQPLLAMLFKKGMALGDGWIGLPFLFVSVAFAITFVLLCAIRQSRSREDSIDGS